MNNKLPNKKTDFLGWYQEIIYQAELADQSPVRGCIVVRPYGNDIWEGIKSVVDRKIKTTGHKNALFPLLIPESFLKREADHIEGFAPELAVVTHAGGKELSEPLVVRPTSETIIHHMFAQWIKSWRDLPLKINQWCSVVRWEMRPRAFLRTSEFFWQEGHTAHKDEAEALEETLLMLNEYKDLAENYLAIPVITGQKSQGEKFPGAVRTYTFEGFMPDAKALQMGTSHLLSQSFAKASDMKFQNKEGKMEFPWLTSWGCTTRLVGAVVMTHGDDKGLILPPKIAPIQLVIIPIFKNDDEKRTVSETVTALVKECEVKGIRYFVDTDEHKTPGNKFYYWELRGVPFRLEIGPKNLAAGTVTLVNRLTGEKIDHALLNATEYVYEQLPLFQKALYERAQAVMESQKIVCKTLQEMIVQSDEHIITTGFCGQLACEKILKEHRMSVRCLLETTDLENCFHCGQKSIQDCIVAQSY